MTFFNSFPLTDYTLNGKNEKIIDMFRTVSLSENNSNIYETVVVTDSDNLESLAEKYYDDPNLSWVIAMVNNIVNPNEDFIKSSNQLQNLYNTKYSGKIIYFEENINLQVGDILVKVDSSVAANTLPVNLLATDLVTNTYAFVTDYSNDFRFARVSNSSFVQSDKIAAYRKIGNTLQLITYRKKPTFGGNEQDACIIIAKKITDYLNSPVYLYDKTNQSILSGYLKFNSNVLTNDYVKLEATGTYADATLVDDNAFRQSILYKILMDNGTVTNVETYFLKQKILDDNEKHRIIKILPKNLLNVFITTFSDLISTKNPNSRVITIKD
jgi:hypothetical protein